MLRIEGLRKSYGEHLVLRGVDLVIEPGEIMGLLGPNGAGKTTLISIVAGLRSADGGRVLVDGQDALRHPERVRPIIGLAPQDLGIYPVLTVERNLRFFGELAGLRGRALRTRIEDVAGTLDLTPMLRRKAAVLSGGQKRRLHTAMALIHRARLVFLDEPTVGADVSTRGRILEVVRGLAAEGCAVCYATHYLPEIEEIGSTVAVLEQGQLIARAPLDDLIARHGAAAIRLTFEGTPPPLQGFTVDGSTATKQTAEPALEAGRVLAGLGSEASRLHEVDIVRPSLEAAYLALTGRRTNEDNDRATGAGAGLKEGVDVAS